MIRTIKYWLDRIEFLWEWKVMKKYGPVIDEGTVEEPAELEEVWLEE